MRFSRITHMYPLLHVACAPSSMIMHVEVHLTLVFYCLTSLPSDLTTVSSCVCMFLFASRWCTLYQPYHLSTSSLLPRCTSLRLLYPLASGSCTSLCETNLRQAGDITGVRTRSSGGVNIRVHYDESQTSPKPHYSTKYQEYGVQHSEDT